MKTIGLVGFGRIGKFITEHLVKEFKVLVFDIDPKKIETIKKIGAETASLEIVAAQEIVIAAVPISHFEATVKTLSPFMKAHSLFIDVCSVKEFPLEVMKKYLPKEIEILATHPMFGPDSAKESLEGAKIVLCPYRISPLRLQKVEHYLKNLGLVLIQTTAEDHDEQISHTLILAHFIGRALIEMKAKNYQIDTKGYKRLMKILETVENDSYQLFLDMNEHNRFAPEVRKKFLAALQKIEGDLK